jgi:NADPH:quinone reductase-like Zn-dependent oxidoreductase
MAGRVEALGEGVTRFQVGDEVFGTCEGAFAEYVSAPERLLAPKPENLTFEQAATVPLRHRLNPSRAIVREGVELLGRNSTD